MFFLKLFSKMSGSIRWRVQHRSPGLYLYVVFPIAVSFLLTFVGARILNNLWPDIYIPWPIEQHVHHYAYGFFILAISGYLALVFSGPRAKYWICWLYGLGLGLAFDEYGLWLNLENNEIARWEYDGFLIIIGTIFLIISAKPGWNFFKHHIPLPWWRRQNH